MKTIKVPIEEYTPCRLSECYLDYNDEIEIGNGNIDFFHLRGIGRIIWLMLDGKHTIRSIVERICVEMSTNDEKGVKEELILILSRLQRRKVIVANWNPIYKLQLSQELEINE